MKKYAKIYEDVFTVPFCQGNKMQKCKIEQVSAADMPLDRYMLQLKETLQEFDLFLFDYIVKIFWLFRQFRYKGRQRLTKRNGFFLDVAFACFMRQYIGYDQRFVTRSDFISRIASYLDDFFPDFNITNPFKIKIKYPYQYVSLPCLVVVRLMDERLDILAEAEKQQMRYTNFLDYVINYINCYNEDHKILKYFFGKTRNSMPYIGINSIDFL